MASGENLHNFFLAKSLDALNDRGILIAVTSKEFINNIEKHQSLLTKIESVADFKGCVRLPQEAFSNANTGAICDILVFQKNESKEINLEKSEENVPEKYWARYKESCLFENYGWTKEDEKE